MGLSDHSVTAKVTEYDPKWGDRPTTDIVDRLRGHWRAAGQGCTSLCMQCAAADHIERLRAEVDIKGHRVDAAADEIDRLRAENAELQEGQLVTRWPLHMNELSPVMAVYDAHRAWIDDHRDIQAAHEQRMRDREQGARSAVLRVAALALCAHRGHDRKLRGCEDCRDDVAEVWRA